MKIELYLNSLIMKDLNKEDIEHINISLKRLISYRLIKIDDKILEK